VSTALKTELTVPEDPTGSAGTTRLTGPAIEAAIERACARVAPLWPLKHFVAVNPFLGFSGQSFASTCATLRRVAGIDMLMPRAFYRQAISEGRIDDRDLARLEVSIAHGHDGVSRPRQVVATVADVLDRLAAGDRQASRTAFMVDEISKWCAAYFDEGQAAWKLPSRHLPPYAAWRAAMRHDRNPEAMGIRGFRKAVGALPDSPVAAIGAVVMRLGIPEHALEDYLLRALLDIAGWAGYARYRVWDSALHDRQDHTLVEILAVRLAWGYALFLERTDAAFQTAWAQAMADAATLPRHDRPNEDPDLAVDLLLQEAYEAGYRRRLVGQLRAASAAPRGRVTPMRKLVQAAFCIDVRSEVYRRALETTCPEIQTIGFAGFFGFAIEYVPIGRLTGGAQCPVLLKPAFTVCEAIAGASEEEETEILGLRLLRRRAAKAWKSFKLSAVSSFTYVETAGLLFAAKIVGDSAGLTRTVQDPNIDGLPRDAIRRVGPRLAPRIVGGRMTGFDAEQRIAMAAAVLRAMSLTEDFARLVLLAGHGSTTANNPHASSLDCGACGGHTGEANARVAAAVLNDHDVRIGLRSRGISIPEDTWFLGALHDTTTDEVRLYGLDDVPGSHRGDLAQLQNWLAKASSLARIERSTLLGIPGGDDIDRRVIARSRDWSQVRPEWGLAGNATFIAAPRERTRGVNLAGRAFLHEYDYRKDAKFSVLELIMTAPMVVASWINLQYYGSTVNNRRFGSGNKTLHNVVGQLGVLEGNSGDLKAGLPWQSVHDGQRLMHEPLRLQVFIEAPRGEISRVIARHASVRELVDHGWVHLLAIENAGQTLCAYRGGDRWEILA
jgi:uncharacterized protein YbcC (UPF0753/DUF2309 family)